MLIYASYHISNTFFLLFLLLWQNCHYLTSPPPQFLFTSINARLCHKHHFPTSLPSLSSYYVISRHLHHHLSHLASPLLPLLSCFLIIIPCLHHHHFPSSLQPVSSSLCTSTAVSIISWLYLVLFFPFLWVKLSAAILDLQPRHCPKLLPRPWPSPYCALWFVLSGLLTPLQYYCSVLLSPLHSALLLRSSCSALLSLYHFFSPLLPNVISSHYSD